MDQFDWYVYRVICFDILGFLWPYVRLKVSYIDQNVYNFPLSTLVIDILIHFERENTLRIMLQLTKFSLPFKPIITFG